uniref:Uncharacterized protein n=1 Tax=Rhizophora mucronata TaxID=61149 RepID=A0A2P2PIE8_RHIMU
MGRFSIHHQPLLLAWFKDMMINVINI